MAIKRTFLLTITMVLSVLVAAEEPVAPISYQERVRQAKERFGRLAFAEHAGEPERLEPLIFAIALGSSEAHAKLLRTEVTELQGDPIAIYALAQLLLAPHNVAMPGSLDALQTLTATIGKERPDFPILPHLEMTCALAGGTDLDTLCAQLYAALDPARVRILRMGPFSIRLLDWMQSHATSDFEVAALEPELLRQHLPVLRQVEELVLAAARAPGQAARELAPLARRMSEWSLRVLGHDRFLETQSLVALHVLGEAAEADFLVAARAGDLAAAGRAAKLLDRQLLLDKAKGDLWKSIAPRYAAQVSLTEAALGVLFSPLHAEIEKLRDSADSAPGESATDPEETVEEAFEQAAAVLEGGDAYEQAMAKIAAASKEILATRRADAQETVSALDRLEKVIATNHGKENMLAAALSRWEWLVGEAEIPAAEQDVVLDWAIDPNAVFDADQIGGGTYRWLCLERLLRPGACPKEAIEARAGRRNLDQVSYWLLCRRHGVEVADSVRERGISEALEFPDIEGLEGFSRFLADRAKANPKEAAVLVQRYLASEGVEHGATALIAFTLARATGKDAGLDLAAWVDLLGQ